MIVAAVFLVNVGYLLHQVNEIVNRENCVVLHRILAVNCFNKRPVFAHNLIARGVLAVIATCVLTCEFAGVYPKVSTHYQIAEETLVQRLILYRESELSQ